MARLDDESAIKNPGAEGSGVRFLAYLTFRSGANHPGPQRGCCSSRSWMAASLIMTPQYNSQSEQCQVKTCSPIEECLVKKPQGNFDRTGVFIGQENRRAYIQLSGRSGTPSFQVRKARHQRRGKPSSSMTRYRQDASVPRDPDRPPPAPRPVLAAFGSGTGGDRGVLGKDQGRLNCWLLTVAESHCW